jgi:RNA polymerase sigma factor FliA
MSAGPAARIAPPRGGESHEAATRLWEEWRRTRDGAAHARLVGHYGEFAKMLAARCYRHRFSQELEFADYAQFALVGLLEAIDRFEPGRGVPFEAYAGQRISGAILDGAESLSERQRQIATRLQVRRERAQSMAHGDAAPGAAPLDPLQRLADIAIGLAIGFVLEDAGIYVSGDVVDSAASPYERLEMAQLCGRLVQLVDDLPDIEGRVIRHHYFQQIPFDQIAVACGLSKGRVSQIHHAALRRLRLLSARADTVLLVT